MEEELSILLNNDPTEPYTFGVKLEETRDALNELEENSVAKNENIMYLKKLLRSFDNMKSDKDDDEEMTEELFKSLEGSINLNL